MLKLVKPQQTQWEELEAKKQQKIQTKAKLEELLNTAVEELKKAIVAGKGAKELEARTIVQNIKEQLENVEEKN